ncbi:MAG: hypothetical protein CVU39_26405 [Chloroflexi bacterium HGW-Chloroflexi-10]|nr:MAG: hypothetical protein CVU39_26405 [Chloroflexi bacterium HGW-Chloroflexi-10]
MMSSKPTTFFLHNPFWLYLSALVCLVFAMGAGFMAASALIVPHSDNPSGWSQGSLFLFGLCAFILCIAVAFHFYGQARYTRLVVAPNGIDYHTPGYSIFATWEDVESIKRLPGSQVGEGLKLKGGKVDCNSPQILNKPQPPYDQFIPLLHFGWNWEKEQLGSLLKEYNPGLFEAKGDK